MRTLDGFLRWLGPAKRKAKPKARPKPKAAKKRAAPKPKAAKKKSAAPKRKATGNEAVAWLTKNGNPHALAGEHFGSTANALRFVRALYAAGAKRVTVAGILREPWRIKEEGGPYATTLMVTLPAGTKAENVETAARREDPHEMVRKGSTLRLWWD